jgi:hypothetical protein
MGDLDVMHGWMSDEERASLPRLQRVLAVCEATQVVPVGQIGDQTLELSFRVISGLSEGRVIRQYISVLNSALDRNGKGRVTFGTLCRALGMPWPDDSQKLHGKPVVLLLSRKYGQEGTPDASYVACSDADLRVWKEWIARQTPGDAQAAGAAPDCTDDGQDVAFE